MNQNGSKRNSSDDNRPSSSSAGYAPPINFNDSNLDVQTRRDEIALNSCDTLCPRSRRNSNQSTASTSSSRMRKMFGGMIPCLLQDKSSRRDSLATFSTSQIALKTASANIPSIDLTDAEESPVVATTAARWNNTNFFSGREAANRLHCTDKTLNDILLSNNVIDLTKSDPHKGNDFPEYPDVSKSHLAVISDAISGKSSGDVIVRRFNLNITLADLNTLSEESWLNDNIINFYMNLLMERRDTPLRVYAMNSFFMPKLLSSGHEGLRRWTQNVDLFSYHLILVPVHVSQSHWCMAVINFLKQTISYYNSLGQPNNSVLVALQSYLQLESLDKRKIPFSMQHWRLENIPNCPAQHVNGDCGVFSCMVAEFLTRNASITFTQEHMRYFRRKMMFEIVTGQILV